MKLVSYDGRPETRTALRLLAVIFVRLGEIRGGEWPEFNLDKAESRIPAELMKMRAEHVVPLAKQPLELLEEIYPLSGRYSLVFPNQSDPQKQTSENTLRCALYRMGYYSSATGS